MIIQVGQAIGALWTIALLIADSILGSMLMRSQGRQAWRRFNAAIAAGRPPAREAFDGALVIFGGAFLLAPGFITDVLGPVAAAAAQPRARAPVHRARGARPHARRARWRCSPRGARRGGRDATARAARRRRRHRRRRSAPNPRSCHDRHARARGPAPARRAMASRTPSRSPSATRRRDVYAVARVGLSGERSASGLGLVFSGGEPVAVQADGEAEVAERSWAAIDAAGLATTVERPLEAWTLSFASDGATFDLQVQALSAPGADGRRRHGGLRAAVPLQRRRHGRRPAHRRSTASASAATPGARPTGSGWRWRGRSASGSARTSACRCWRSARTAPIATTRSRSPRTCTRAASPCACSSRACRPTYDGEQRQRRAGLELWVDEESPPAPGSGRDRLRHLAGPRPAAPGLRLPALAHGRARGRRALRHPAPRRLTQAQLSEPSRSQR